MSPQNKPKVRCEEKNSICANLHGLTLSEYIDNPMVHLPVISKQDQHEAQSVSARQDGFKFEIQLGHLCNNRCVFCSSGQLTELGIARRIELDPIREAIRSARDAGAKHLTFLGGEPTIHKDFLQALAYTVSLGFEHIVIFTNGVMFPVPGFLEKVLALGTFEWRISIQGGNEQAHVATTKRKDSFQRIEHGLKLLQQHRQLVTVNMCANERSYRSLPDYVSLVQKYGIQQLHIDIVRPSSAGTRDEAYMRDILIRYRDMAPYLDTMLQGFHEYDPTFDVNIGNLPYCVLPQWYDRIHHGGETTITRASDSTGLESEVDKYAWHASMRSHPAGCNQCAMRSQCTGVFQTYLDLFGDQEFVPIDSLVYEQARTASEVRNRHARLLQHGRQRVQQTVQQLRSAVQEKSWQLSEVYQHGRRSSVTVTFAPDTSVTLEFTVGVQNNRSQLSVDVQLTDPNDADRVRPLVTELLLTLKSLR